MKNHDRHQLRDPTPSPETVSAAAGVPNIASASVARISQMYRMNGDMQRLVVEPDGPLHWNPLRLRARRT